MDRDSIQFCICEKRYIYITASYHDFIGFVEEIAYASSFVGFWDFGDLDFVYKSLPLPLNLDFEGIRTCFRGILWLEN